MLQSFTDKFYQGLTGRTPSALVLDETTRDEILYNGKRLRSKDYVFEFGLTGSASHEKTETTTARWKFLLTGAAVYFENIDTNTPPTVGIRFESSASLSPFRADDPAQMNRVLASLVLPMEGKPSAYFPYTYLEEFKNLYYMLDQRVNITVSIKPGVTTDFKAYVLLTGLEIFEGADDE